MPCNIHKLYFLSGHGFTPPPPALPSKYNKGGFYFFTKFFLHQNLDIVLNPSISSPNIEPTLLGVFANFTSTVYPLQKHSDITSFNVETPLRIFLKKGAGNAFSFFFLFL